MSKNFSGGDPIYSETMQDWRAHDGVDLEAAVGEAVRAMADGEVLRCYEDPLLGHTVEIAHGGGVTARYCGLGETFLVREGDAVAAGQEIGSVYQVPCECAERSHLHLELERNGSLFDPLFKPRLRRARPPHGGCRLSLPRCPSCAFLRRPGVSASAEAELGRCPNAPPPFEKGGRKL